MFDMKHHPICDAEVIRIEEERVRVRIPQSNMAGEQLETEMYVTFYDNSYGLVTYLCQIAKDKQADHVGQDNMLYHVYECRLMKKESVVQRRNDYKIPFRLETKFYYKEEDGEIHEVEGTIMDMSAGGIFFLSKKQFHVSEQVAFPFSSEEAIVTLSCEILRIQDPNEYRKGEQFDPDMKGYGCRFLNLSSKEERMIRRFVLQEDLRLHKERKEKEEWQELGENEHGK